MKDDLQCNAMQSFGERQPMIEDKLEWKINMNGRPLSMEDYLRWKKTCDGRQASMEVDL